MFYFILGRPSSAESLILVDIANGVPTFSFVAGFNGGRKQTFIVETTVVGTENWREQLRFTETDKQFAQDQHTFTFSLKDFPPNNYVIRILSENIIGRIETEKAPTLRFEIEKPGKKI